MDDRHGNVIDGTVRARHWRGSKSKTHPTADETGARSDAPKSFAGSLLVPAEMLTAAQPEERFGRAEQSRTSPISASADVGETGAVPAATGGHQNPFLVADAAQATPRVRPARWLHASFVARVAGLVRIRRTVSFAAAVVVIAAGVLVIDSVLGGSPAKPRRSPVVVTASTSSWETAVAAKARMLARAARADQISERPAAGDLGQARRRRDVMRHRAANRRSAVGASATPPSEATVEAPGSSSSAGSITSASYSVPPSTNHGFVGGAATSTGPAQPAGPAGTAAGTVGSNCNPKCS
jgi:hypothetical protein